MYNRNSPPIESDDDFGKKFAAACDASKSSKGIGAVILVFATEDDYHQIHPELSDIPHARYIRSTAGAVIAAQQRGRPVMLKELRAKPYFAWLARHGLEQSDPHLILYASFAPLLKDPELLAQLGFIPADPRLVHTPGQDSRQLDPAWTEAAEALAVKLAVSYRFNHPDSVLCLVYAMRVFATNATCATAMAALADKLATGMAEASVRLAQTDSMILAAEWQHIRLAGRN
jgi:hypothetical protein